MLVSLRIEVPTCGDPYMCGSLHLELPAHRDACMRAAPGPAAWPRAGRRTPVGGAAGPRDGTPTTKHPYSLRTFEDI